MHLFLPQMGQLALFEPQDKGSLSFPGVEAEVSLQWSNMHPTKSQLHLCNAVMLIANDVVLTRMGVCWTTEERLLN